MCGIDENIISGDEHGMDIRSVVLPAAARENRFILTVFKVDALDVNTAGVLIRIVGIALVNIQITAAAFGDDGIIRTVVVYPAEISVRCVINVFVIECDSAKGYSGRCRHPRIRRIPTKDQQSFRLFRKRFLSGLRNRKRPVYFGCLCRRRLQARRCRVSKASNRRIFHKYSPFCEYKIQ